MRGAVGLSNKRDPRRKQELYGPDTAANVRNDRVEVIMLRRLVDFVRTIPEGGDILDSVLETTAVSAESDRTGGIVARAAPPGVRLRNQ